MSFGTKGYTISYFINLFSGVRSNTITSKGVFNIVSPRLGATSVRALVLNTWLNGSTTAIVNGTGKFASYGATPRARLLKALKLRKQNRG